MSGASRHEDRITNDDKYLCDAFYRKRIVVFAIYEHAAPRVEFEKRRTEVPTRAPGGMLLPVGGEHPHTHTQHAHNYDKCQRVPANSSYKTGMPRMQWKCIGAWLRRFDS